MARYAILIIVIAWLGGCARFERQLTVRGEGCDVLTIEKSSDEKQVRPSGG